MCSAFACVWCGLVWFDCVFVFRLVLCWFVCCLFGVVAVRCVVLVRCVSFCFVYVRVACFFVGSCSFLFVTFIPFRCEYVSCVWWCVIVVCVSLFSLSLCLLFCCVLFLICCFVLFLFCVVCPVMLDYVVA